MRFKTTIALAVSSLFLLGGSALAQSQTAPAGREPATAPGGTTGLAGPRNVDEAIRDGDALPAATPLADPRATTGSVTPAPVDAPPPPAPRP